METAIPYAIFLIACFVLAWSTIAIANVLTQGIIWVIAKAHPGKSLTFGGHMLAVCLSFTYIMGYIFLY